MQPPISVGTILQNRYRLISILGQGGFGRTYLAEDQGRFNERCALKEFIPAQSGSYALEKSKELFQREAAILYQIQHPQVPQFRATFEQDQRLFLVQDYVEGKTYGTLVQERTAQGYPFSEAEVIQLLRQILPVLAHIHSKGIIHRDIAPDNLILRESDHLPVLIDFGVVKDLATRIQSPETVPQPTTVGKFGYAPGEQMQTGRAYPSSDLYSLAVVAIVLLTGKEPQEIYNESTLTWQWQESAKVSPGFAQVLNRMLSYKPGDRYQSVAEVVQALQALTQPTAISPPAPPPPYPGQFPSPPLPPIPAQAQVPSPPPPPTQTPPQSPPSPADPNLSQVATVAVGGRSSPVNPNPNSDPNRTGPVIPPPSNGPAWENPWAIAAVGTTLALAAGLGSWALVTSLLRTPEDPVSPTPTVVISPTPAPSPSPSPIPSPSPTPTPTPSPVQFSQRLRVAPGEQNTVQGGLKANETISYIVPGQQDQTLSAYLGGEGILMTVLGPDQNPVNNRARRVSAWEGTLPYTGDYSIQLSPVRGIAQADYELELNVKNPPEPTPSPSPTSAPAPSSTPTAVDVERVSFPAGTTETQISGQTNPTTIKRYLVTAQAGQVLNVEIVAGAATLDIRYPDGRLVEDASGIVSWQSQLLTSGDYQIDVIAARDTSFTLNVSMQAPEPPRE
jgi:serine/threonine-protein kinase